MKHSAIVALSVVLTMVLFLTAPEVRSTPEAGPWHSVDDGIDPTVDLHFFWTTTCPHCRKARPFVQKLGDQYPWLKLHTYELRSNPDHVKRYIELARQVGGDARSVPGFIYCGRMMFTSCPWPSSSPYSP